MNPQLLAILAGVVRCIEESKEAEEAKTAAGGPAAGMTSPWALHGRQGIMRMRALVQQRVLRR